MIEDESYQIPSSLLRNSNSDQIMHSDLSIPLEGHVIEGKYSGNDITIDNHSSYVCNGPHDPSSSSDAVDVDTADWKNGEETFSSRLQSSEGLI